MAKLYSLATNVVSGITNGTNTINQIADPGISTILGFSDTLDIIINVSNAGTATGTVNLFLQDSFDGGTTWDDVVASNAITLGTTVGTQRFVVQGKIATGITQGSAAATETLAAGTIRVGPFGDRLRLREKVSGASGTPVGCTYSITLLAK